MPNLKFNFTKRINFFLHCPCEQMSNKETRAKKKMSDIFLSDI